MKNILPIMFCLLGINAAFGQVELKGFLEGSYFEYDISWQDTSSFINSGEQRFYLRPSFAVSLYRIDRAFHEFGITNVSISKSYDNRQNGTLPSVQTLNSQISFLFRYNYNFCILKTPKKWLPYVGLQTNHQFQRSNAEQGTNQAKTTGIISQVGLAAGVQYKIKENFRLELQLPFDFLRFRYQHQNLTSSQVPNGQVRQYVDVSLVENPFASIPIRLGLAVRI